VVVVLTSQAYNWYVEKSKRSHDDVERSFYDAIKGKLVGFSLVGARSPKLSVLRKELGAHDDTQS
jgi:hypothetical protein|nr:hypothetical protein [Desulfofustis sp. PB-SRB1]